MAEMNIEKIINGLTARFNKYQENGLTPLEIGKFVCQCVIRFAGVVHAMEDLTRAEQRAEITRLVTMAYKKIDPDIPGVPAFFETGLEDLLLSTVPPALYDALADAWD